MIREIEMSGDWFGCVLEETRRPFPSTPKRRLGDRFSEHLRDGERNDKDNSPAPSSLDSSAG